MKKLITLFIFLMILTQGAWAQSQKTLVKSIPIEGASIVASLEGTVETTEWDKDFVRVTATVDVKNFNEDILKRLFSVGRYEIVATTKDGVTTLMMPKLATKVTIRGQQLLEEVTYEISVPKGMALEVKEIKTAGPGI